MPGQNNRKKLSTKKQGQNNQTSGSPHTSNNIEELTTRERQQQVTIEQLLERVVDLEMEVKDLESELSITKTTSGK